MPSVVSMSFGVPEAFTCNQGIGNCTNANQVSYCRRSGKSDADALIFVQYIQRANTELAKIAARGVTLLAASGDNGAPGDVNDDCS